jgi:tetratricopeptide (TPR) repeat protein
MSATSHLQTATLSRLEELQRRVQRDPASISFAALAEEYRRLGLFQEAVDVCRSGLTRHPSYLSARVTLGRALLELGDFDGATSELERVLQAAPENLAAIRALAELHRRRSESPDDDQELLNAIVAPPAAVDTPVVAARESLLAAIERARRDVAFQSAR